PSFAQPQPGGRSIRIVPWAMQPETGNSPCCVTLLTLNCMHGPTNQERPSMSSRTRNCSFELDSRGFVRATIDRGASVDVNDAREATRAAWSVAGEERRPILVDMRGIVSKTREARQHFASADAARMHVAVALLVASPLSRVIVNL